MSNDLSLQDLINSALNDAKNRLASQEEEVKQDGTLFPSGVEEEVKTASLVDPEYIEKLASSLDYITEKVAEGAVVNPVTPQGALPATAALDGPPPPHKSTKPAGGKDAANAAGEAMGTGVAGAKNQIANDHNDVPGGTGGYPEKGPLVNGPSVSKHASIRDIYMQALSKVAEDDEEDSKKEKKEEKAEVKAEKKEEKTKEAKKKEPFGKRHPYLTSAAGIPFGSISAPKGHGWDVAGHQVGGAVGGSVVGSLAGAAAERLSGGRIPRGIGQVLGQSVGANAGQTYFGGKRLARAHKEGKTKKAAAAETLKAALLRKLAGEDVLPAKIAAPAAGGALVGAGELGGVSDATQPPPTPTGQANAARSLIQSNQAATDATKGSAKAPVKKQLKEVLDEPALSKKTDPVLDDSWKNSGAAGVKIAESAKVLLQKVAEEGSPEQQERLLAVMTRTGNLAKVAEEDQDSAKPEGEDPKGKCSCEGKGEGKGECKVCRLKAALSAGSKKEEKE